MQLKIGLEAHFTFSMSDFIKFNTPGTPENAAPKQIALDFPENPKEALEDLLGIHSKYFRKAVGRPMIATRARELFEQLRPRTRDQIDEIVQQAVSEWRERNRKKGEPFATKARQARARRVTTDRSWLDFLLTPAPQSTVAEGSSNRLGEMLDNRRTVRVRFKNVFSDFERGKLSLTKLLAAIREAEGRAVENNLDFIMNFAQVCAERFPWKISSIREDLRAIGYPITAGQLQAGGGRRDWGRGREAAAQLWD
ncbi:MAG: hypothetical protein ABIH35_02450 [Patescibacteria group bacterium]